MSKFDVLAVLLLATVTTAACAEKPRHSRLAVDDFPVARCRVAYRPTLSTGLQSEEVELRPGDGRSLAFHDVTIEMTYSFSKFEGATLWIDAKLPNATNFFTRSFYQFIAGQPPTGHLFQGGHGFTGLVYVHPPGSSSEAQYFCQANEGN